MITKTTTQILTSSRAGLLETIALSGGSRLADHQRLNLLSMDQHVQSALFPTQDRSKLTSRTGMQAEK
jgi:hypothetical protein